MNSNASSSAAAAPTPAPATGTTSTSKLERLTKMMKIVAGQIETCRKSVDQSEIGNLQKKMDKILAQIRLVVATPEKAKSGISKISKKSQKSSSPTLVFHVEDPKQKIADLEAKRARRAKVRNVEEAETPASQYISPFGAAMTRNDGLRMEYSDLFDSLETKLPKIEGVKSFHDLDRYVIGKIEDTVKFPFPDFSFYGKNSFAMTEEWISWRNLTKLELRVEGLKRLLFGKELILPNSVTYQIPELVDLTSDEDMSDVVDLTTEEANPAKVPSPIPAVVSPFPARVPSPIPEVQAPVPIQEVPTAAPEPVKEVPVPEPVKEVPVPVLETPQEVAEIGSVTKNRKRNRKVIHKK